MIWLSIPNPLREEVILPLEILFNDDFGRSLNFPLHKRSFSTYTLNLLKKRSLRKRLTPNPYEGHLERLKDGIPSDAIEGEQSHMETTFIFSPFVPTSYIEYEPILDPYDSFYALSPELPDDPRKPFRYPTHRNHQDHREEQHLWLESIKKLCAIAIEWMDKA
jgi:hypothetical protein